jgi:hypothetical protein
MRTDPAVLMAEFSAAAGALGKTRHYERRRCTSRYPAYLSMSSASSSPQRNLSAAATTGRSCTPCSG